VDKLAAFFLARELDGESIERLSKNDSLVNSAVAVVGGNFSWNPRFSTSQSLVLKNININVKCGELVAIVGGVGCGE
jgi:ABC-type transport system involved in cytochrome bd biosynthesis fused ATPase/permease subunit